MKKQRVVDRNEYPKGLNAERVKQIVDYYDNQTDDEAVAEFESAMRKQDEDTVMRVPKSLVPKVRRLIARHQRSGQSISYKLKDISAAKEERKQRKTESRSK